MAATNGQAEPRSSKAFIKQQKARLERRRAKSQPDCVAQYRRYRGYA